MITKKPPLLQEHPILQPFRLDGRWYDPSDKTIKLLPQQTSFLLMNGKIGKPSTPTKEVSK
ncbi:hypothetical protein L4D77_26255 [Photobacterium frigidiphilum]|uniref:hypothetical protein n=1 Tax=Photobacterium frigidiphilum TaxID=264736 RepID=UPI003D0FEDB3